MLSVRNVPREAVEGAIAQVKDTELALRNGHTHFVIAGAPAALRQVESLIEQAAEKHNAELDDKRSGGTRAEPLFNELKVSAPFHFTAMQPGADRADRAGRPALGSTVSAQALAEEHSGRSTHDRLRRRLSALTTSTEITHVVKHRAGVTAWPASPPSFSTAAASPSLPLVPLRIATATHSRPPSRRRTPGSGLPRSWWSCRTAA